MALQLHSRGVGSGTAVILLHGLFGSGANLGALARALRDDYRVYSLDLPNHGRSSWLEHPDLPTMAGAVAHWMDEEGVASAHLLGHSLGGKVVMQLALDDPGRVISLSVADIAPVAYRHGFDDLIDPILELDLDDYDSRGQVDQSLQNRVDG